MEKFILSFSQEAQDLIKSGEAYRQGGVVLLKNGRIFEWLQDASLVEKASSTTNLLIGVSAVPLAVIGISLVAINNKLKKIQYEIKVLSKKIEGLEKKVDDVNNKLDAQMLGELRGALENCQTNIDEGRFERLPELRDKCNECYNKLKNYVENVVRESVVRDCPDILAQYMRAMLLAGIAVRDLSYIMGEYKSTMNYSNRLLDDSKKLKDSVYDVVDSIQALFWRQDVHLDLAIEAKESYERLASHVLLLKELPAEEIKKIQTSQIKS